jgi:hypothetical protein
MRVLKNLTLKLVCIGLVLSSTLTSAVSVDAFAASSLSKKQQQARDHKRKKAGKLSKPQKGNKSSSNRKGVKNGSKGKEGACTSRMSRSTSRARCQYQPIKSISAFK